MLSIMKYFILVAALFAAACALPTDIELRSNSTKAHERLSGWGAFGGGTYGGRGGSVFTVWDAWALRDALDSNSPRIVYLRGRIDVTALFTGSPGIRLWTGSFTSVIGGDSNAMIVGGGIYVLNNVQVIVQNIKFHNVISYAPGEEPNGAGGIISMVAGDWSTIDAITLDGSEYTWIDHCEFADDPWIAANTPTGRRRHNNHIGMIRGPNLVTISNSIFRNHNFCILVGADDGHGGTDIGRLKTTFYGNWFMGCIQRNPFVRFGEVHVFNNLYTDITEYGVGVGVQAQVYVERNVFNNVRRAFAGSSNPPGHILQIDNILNNSGQDAGIPNNVNWRPFEYYSYNLLATNQVEWSVRSNAGTR